ncbi:MAG TPA: cache domain-containing protein [Paucimonas sp.]|nr:cache domain-containing protein [Paucimonas sp.]
MACLVALLAMSSVQAAEYGTPDEAVALVKKAIAYLKANGPEKTWAEINKPGGQFTDRDLYIFVAEIGGPTLAHGANQKMVGKSMSELKDADGKFFVREFLKVADAKGSGWVDYRWPHPVSKELVQKSTYVEKYEKYLFGCGVYKK